MASSEDIILCVKKYPILYDPQHLKYKGKRKIWSKVAEELGEEVDVVMRKWKNIRDAYVKHLKAKLNKKSGSRYWKGFALSKQIEFMKPYYMPKLSKLKPEIKEEEEEEEDSDDSSYSSPERYVKSEKSKWPKSNPKQECPKITRDSDDVSDPESVASSTETIPILQDSTPILQDATPILQDPTPTLSQSKQEPSTEYNANEAHPRLFNSEDVSDLLFLGFAKIIKTFSPARQAFVRMKVAQLVMEQEIAHIQNTGSLDSGFAEEGLDPQGKSMHDQSSPNKDIKSYKVFKRYSARLNETK